MNKIIISTVILALTGCAVVKVPRASGGSKSDGIVELSYSYGSIEFPKVDYSQADKEAANACMIWGYDNASPLAGKTQQCHSWDQWGGCASATITIKYQCF
jgi:hypothetical protein